MEGIEEQAVVVLAGGDGCPVERSRIQGDPGAIGDALDAVGDDQMSMKLWITCTGLPVIKSGGDGAVGSQMGNAVTPGAGMDDLVFKPLEGLIDGFLVNLSDLVLHAARAQRPQDRYRFGNAEGQIEPDDGVACARLARFAFDDCGLAVRSAQGSSSVGVDGMIEDRFGVGFGDDVARFPADAV